jgi:cytohesin
MNLFNNISFFALSHIIKKQQIKDELAEVVQEMEQHDSESKHSSKEKQMSIGRKKFNMDPKKG